MFWAGFEPATAAPVWGNVQASERPEPCWYHEWGVASSGNPGGNTDKPDDFVNMIPTTHLTHRLFGGNVSIQN